MNIEFNKYKLALFVIAVTILYAVYKAFERLYYFIKLFTW